MKYLHKIMGGVALILMAFLLFWPMHMTDSELKSKAVRLVREGKGMCSGEQVKAPSGATYILTAAHCLGLAQDGVMDVVTERGVHLKRRVIAEDPMSDLLLLEGLPGVDGLKIGTEQGLRGHVRTYTHGRNMDTYRTDGELIMFHKVAIFLNIIASEEDEARCLSMPKLSIISNGIEKACILTETIVETTAMIVPGSSGGMVVNDNDELIGVVSAGDGTFGGLVLLSDIRAFLLAY